MSNHVKDEDRLIADLILKIISLSGYHVQRVETDPLKKLTEAMAYPRGTGDKKEPVAKASVDGIDDAAYRRAAEQLAKQVGVDLVLSYP